MTTPCGIRLVSEDKELVDFELRGMHDAGQGTAGAVSLTTLPRALREKNKEIIRRTNWSRETMKRQTNIAA